MKSVNILCALVILEEPATSLVDTKFSVLTALCQEIISSSKTLHLEPHGARSLPRHKVIYLN